MHTTSCSPQTFARGVVVAAVRAPWRAFGHDLFRFVLFLMTIMGGVGTLFLVTALFVAVPETPADKGPFDDVVLFACMISVPLFLGWVAKRAYAAVQALCALGQDVSHA